MPNPILIQFMQVSKCAIAPTAFTIEWVLQNSINQFDHLCENTGRTPMIAIVTNHRLKSGGQKAPGFHLKIFPTHRTYKEVRKNAGQTQHPHFEVASGELKRTTLFESPDCHTYQTEDRILWFVLRKKPIDQLHKMSGTNRPIIIFEKFHWRIQQVCRLDSYQIPVVLFKELNTGMRQWLQRSAEPVFHPACAIGHTSHLSVIAAEKCDDPIGLPERISLQYNRIALMERHSAFSVTLQINMPDGVDARGHSTN